MHGLNFPNETYQHRFTVLDMTVASAQAIEEHILDELMSTFFGIICDECDVSNFKKIYTLLV